MGVRSALFDAIPRSSHRGQATRVRPRPKHSECQNESPFREPKQASGIAILRTRPMKAAPEASRARLKPDLNAGVKVGGSG